MVIIVGAVTIGVRTIHGNLLPERKYTEPIAKIPSLVKGEMQTIQVAVNLQDDVNKQTDPPCCFVLIEQQCYEVYCPVERLKNATGPVQ